MLYMMAQHSFDLKTQEELFLIKVGLSRNIGNRASSYRSDNPSAKMIFSTAGTEYDESKCHSFLYHYGTRYQGEWFKVSKEFFDYCLKYGFIGFPLKRKDQNIYIENSSYLFDQKDFIAQYNKFAMKDRL